jgi:hypothetical protein
LGGIVWFASAQAPAVLENVQRANHYGGAKAPERDSFVGRKDLILIKGN